MATFAELYQERCYLKDNKLIPHYWKPQAIEKTPPLIFSDERNTVDESWGVDTVIQKIIALGLNLEIPVGEFVNEATKKEIPEVKGLKELLKSNIADEASHYKGFVLAADAYGLNKTYDDESKNILNMWLAVDCHPIEAAQAIETGVLLCTLGFLRLAGGKSLCNMAGQIAKDEYRHVTTNRGYLKMLDLPLMPNFWYLIEETLLFVFEGLNIPKKETGIKCDKDFFINSGKSLLENGEAKKLDSLVSYVHHYLPFEIPNKDLYNRVI